MYRTIFTKFQDKDNTYRIRTSIGRLNMSLVILEEMKEEMKAYKTSMILEQNLRMHASRLGLQLEDYFQKLVKIFENPNNIKFNFNKKSLTILEALNANVNVKYFNCDLIYVEDFPSFIGDFIDQTHTKTVELEKNYEDLDVKYKLLEKEAKDCKDKLKELVDRKKVDDEVMLGNFVLLLNEKKRRIQHLSELLEAFRIDPSLANPVEVNVNAKRKRKSVVDIKQPPAKIKEEISESESDDDSNNGYNTSDEIVDVAKTTNVENTVTSQYIDDIFDESPPQNIVKPKLLEKMEIEPCLPSTSKEINGSKQNLKESKKPSSSSSFCTPVVEINTQDWLDGL